MDTDNGHQPTQAINEEKLRLIALLERSRRESMAALQGVDPYTVVHEASGWKVKDIIGHLAAWEREALASLQAHAEGDEYSLGPDHHNGRYNQAAYEQRRNYDPAQCRIDWGMVRRDLQFAVHDLSPERMGAEMRFPSHRQGSVTTLIERMVAHEEAHIQEIVALLAAAPPP